jgi:hypothetical protein
MPRLLIDTTVRIDVLRERPIAARLFDGLRIVLFRAETERAGDFPQSEVTVEEWPVGA